MDIINNINEKEQCPVIIHGRDQFFIRSREENREYRIFIAKPDAFQTYVAGSLSIHWNKKPILEEEQKFLINLRRKESNCNINIMLAAGELEKGHFSCMNDNARELSERLSAYENKDLKVQFHEFEGEGHVPLLPVLINKALRFALNPVI